MKKLISLLVVAAVIALRISARAAQEAAGNRGASASPPKILMTCYPGDSDTSAGIESLNIMRSKQGRLIATLTVSGPGDSIETYTYYVEQGAPSGSGVGVTGYHGDGFALALPLVPENQGTPLAGSLEAVAPRSAQMAPGFKFSDDDLSCNAPGAASRGLDRQ